jgi:hypothetical protein
MLNKSDFENISSESKKLDIDNEIIKNKIISELSYGLREEILQSTLSKPKKISFLSKIKRLIFGIK